MVLARLRKSSDVYVGAIARMYHSDFERTTEGRTDDVEEEENGSMMMKMSTSEKKPRSSLIGVEKGDPYRLYRRRRMEQGSFRNLIISVVHTRGNWYLA